MGEARRWAAVLVAALILPAARVAVATAAERTAVWTTREDFEAAPPGMPPRILVNLDAAAATGSLALAALATPAPAPAFTVAAAVTTNAPPALAANARAHEYLLLWRNDDKGIDVLGQIVDRAGAPRGKRIPVAVTPAVQYRPRAAWADSTNQYLAVWEDTRDGDPSIYARRIAADGRLSGKEFAVAPGAGVQELPDVAVCQETGIALVTWVARGGEGPAVHARRISAQGKLLGPVLGLSGSGARPEGPRAAAGADGSFLVVWTDRGAAGADIRGRVVSPAGTPEMPVLALRSASHGEDLSSLSAGGGGYLLVWDDYRAEPPLDRLLTPERSPEMADAASRAGTGVDVYAQRLDAAGASLGAEIAVCAAKRNQLRGDAAWVPATGHHLVAWQDGRHGYEAWTVGLRPVGGGEHPPGESVFETQEREQLMPALACDPGPGECLLAWWYQLPRRGRFDLLARRVAFSPGAAGELSGVTVDAEVPWAAWGALSWTAATPFGTGVSFRTRSAADAEGLARAAWSEPLTVPGQAVASPPGRWLEIEARLESSDGRSRPVLEEFSLRYRDDPRDDPP